MYIVCWMEFGYLPSGAVDVDNSEDNFVVLDAREEAVSRFDEIRNRENCVCAAICLPLDATEPHWLGLGG